MKVVRLEQISKVSGLFVDPEEFYRITEKSLNKKNSLINLFTTYFTKQEPKKHDKNYSTKRDVVNYRILDSSPLFLYTFFLVCCYSLLC